MNTGAETQLCCIRLKTLQRPVCMHCINQPNDPHSANDPKGRFSVGWDSSRLGLGLKLGLKLGLRSELRSCNVVTHDTDWSL